LIAKTRPGEVHDALPASPPDEPEDFAAAIADLDRIRCPPWRRRHAARSHSAVASRSVGFDIGNPHARRSIFRDWAEDIGGFRRETAEAALAHSRGAVEGAYSRETAVAARTPMMAAYANWLTGEGESSVVAFPPRA
jgi:hypothetical protein